MFGISYQDLVKRIKLESNLSEEEINAKVKQKLAKLSDLLSKEGAAHIVAHELGINLLKPSGKLTIEKLIPGMNSVNMLCKVVKIYGIREFKKESREGKVANLLVGDETGVTKVVIWDTNLIKLIEENKIKEDSVLKIKNAYVKDNNGYKELHLGQRSEIEINPANESVEVKPMDSIRDYLKIQIKDLEDTSSNVGIFGTITQVFEPRFYEACPECNKKVKLSDGEFRCDTHEKVQEKLVPILNFIFDDSTDSIRATAFRENAEKILGLNSSAIYELRQQPEKIEELKGKILGKQLTIIGRVNKNEMFARKEFSVQRIEDKGNVVEEMQIS
jgi:ssDNA-binding replication factor A large subunit